MDSILELTNLLKSGEKKLFRQFLQHKNKRADVKNLQLLDLIESDDIKNLEKLYESEKNNDAYYALRKRLQYNLLLFLSQRTFESNHSDTYDALRLVVVGRFLLENDVVRTAFKCLDKAERLAEHLEQFNLLNELLLLKAAVCASAGSRKSRNADHTLHAEPVAYAARGEAQSGLCLFETGIAGNTPEGENRQFDGPDGHYDQKIQNFRTGPDDL
jgi:hypothetical protein